MRKLLNEELGRINVEDFKSLPKTPVVVVLDNVRSLMNVGSVFRTADSFRLEALYLCGITGCPPHRDIQKTALGATESVEWHYVENSFSAVKMLQEKGYKIVSVEQAEKATYLHQFNPNLTEKYALVLGNEVEGVAQEIVSSSDVVLEIPQIGTKHSLNIAVSAGIVCWDFYNKLMLSANF